MNVTKLLEDYHMRIISATHQRPLSVQEMNRGLGVPIASAYRIVRELVADGMLTVAETKRARSTSGQAENFYLSMVRQIRVVMKDGKVTARVELASGTVLNEEVC